MSSAYSVALDALTDHQRDLPLIWPNYKALIAYADPELRAVLSAVIKLTIQHAMPFFIGRNICELIEAALPTYPLEKEIDRSDLPYQAGFAYLEKPLIVTGSDGVQDKVRAIVWSVMKVQEYAITRWPPLEILWLVEARSNPRYLVPHSDYTRTLPANLKLLTLNDQPLDDSRQDFFVEAGKLPRTDNNEPKKLEVADIETLDKLRAYFGSLLAFMQQPFVVQTEETAERHARKRSEAQNKRPAPAINVVLLRKRPQNHQPSDEHEPRDWQFQWLVRGHWRNQYYRSSNSHRLLYIAPYTKGNTDGPLRVARPTVFAVTR